MKVVISRGETELASFETETNAKINFTIERELGDDIVESYSIIGVDLLNEALKVIADCWQTSLKNMRKK